MPSLAGTELATRVRAQAGMEFASLQEACQGTPPIKKNKMRENCYTLL